MHAHRLLVLALLFAACAQPAQAIVIDDFSVGPIVVERTGASVVTHLQSDLDPAHVIGGSREFIVGESGDVGQRAEVDSVARELRFHHGAGLGYHRVTYGADSPLNLNLLATGHRAFHLEFVDPVGQPPLWFTVSSPVGANIVSETVSMVAVPVTTLANGNKRAVFEFDWFSGIDLTNVSSIDLHSVRVGRDMVLKSVVTVVPEPAGAVLVAMAGTGCICRRRRRRDSYQCGTAGRSAHKVRLIDQPYVLGES